MGRIRSENILIAVQNIEYDQVRYIPKRDRLIEVQVIGGETVRFEHKLVCSWFKIMSEVKVAAGVSLCEMRLPQRGSIQPRHIWFIPSLFGECIIVDSVASLPVEIRLLSRLDQEGDHISCHVGSLRSTGEEFFRGLSGLNHRILKE